MFRGLFFYCLLTRSILTSHFLWSGPQKCLSMSRRVTAFELIMSDPVFLKCSEITELDTESAAVAEGIVDPDGSVALLNNCRTAGL